MVLIQEKNVFPERKSDRLLSCATEDNSSMPWKLALSFGKVEVAGGLDKGCFYWHAEGSVWQNWAQETMTENVETVSVHECFEGQHKQTSRWRQQVGTQKTTLIENWAIGNLCFMG